MLKAIAIFESGGGGTGTVTSVSVATANGFAGSVATPTTTPAITLSTTATGILKGNGTAISAAVAADFPTLNQNTTGSAATLTNPRTIGGVAFDGSANIVPQTIQSVNEATDTTCFPLFITASGTQSLQPLNNAALTFNSSTGALGATSFSGAGTGLTGTASSLTAGNVTTNANLTGDVTSVGNASTLALGVAHTWTAQQNFASSALSFSGTIAWNLNTAQAASILATSNIPFTLSNPTNMVNGGSYSLIVTQFSTGGQVITWGSAYKFSGGSKFVLSTANNAVDIITFLSDGTSMFAVGQAAFS